MTQVRRVRVDDGDGLEFVISDGTLDRHGTRINPKGWDLANFKKNPIALFGHDSDYPIGTWKDVRQEKDRLVGTLKLAAPGTSQRIDELISLVDQKILRAVSVGFQPTKFGTSGKDEFDFVEQELIEVSLVSVPSNTNALQMARSLQVSESTIALAFGEQATSTQRRELPNGEHAAKPPVKTKGPMMDTLSKRVESAQTNFNVARDAYQAHVAEDDFDIERSNDLKAEMDARKERLDSLKEAERSLASSTAEHRGDVKPKAPAVRKPLGLREREPKPGDLIVRNAVIQTVAMLSNRDPMHVLQERYGDHEATNVFVRTAVDPAKTTVSGWASELIETETAAFMERLRAASVYAQLASLGTSLTFGPGRGAIKIPARSTTPSVSGAFVLEGAPIPVRRIGLTSATLTPHKLAVISYFTRELARLSNPQIEDLLREEITADTALTVDTLLLDATAGSTTRPAGLINGVSATTASTAGGYAAIIEDLQALAAPFDTANAGRNLALIMNPREARYIAMTPGPDGRFGWADQFLDEFTIIKSTTVPAGDVFLIDAADFATAAGSPEFDVSEQAVIHAEDTSPANIGTAGSPNVVAAPVISMFQTASIALRMIQELTWAMRRTGMVKWIDNADWAPVAP